MVANYGKIQEYPALQEIVKAAFPSYKKQTIVFVVANEVALSETSKEDDPRNVYVAVDWKSRKKVKTPKVDTPEGSRLTPKFSIPAGTAILEGSMIEDKLVSVIAYVHPDDVGAYIGANEV